MDIPFRIPGTTVPDIVIRRSRLGKVEVLVDGLPAMRPHPQLDRYKIPLADGSVVDLELKGGWTGLKAVTNGVETPLEPRLPRYLIALIFLPFVLVVIGGFVGAAGAVGAAALNSRIARLPARPPIKIAAMLGVTGMIVPVYLGVSLAIAFAMSPIPTLEVGRCVNGLIPGAAVTSQTTRAVACTTIHDSEVVGIVRYPEEGVYPGYAAIASYAETRCVDAFGEYVGIDLVLSDLDMVLVAPTDATWSRGDRMVSCVALRPNGGKLTGSILGSAQ